MQTDSAFNFPPTRGDPPTSMKKAKLTLSKPQKIEITHRVSCSSWRGYKFRFAGSKLSSEFVYQFRSVRSGRSSDQSEKADSCQRLRRLGIRSPLSPIKKNVRPLRNQSTLMTAKLSNLELTRTPLPSPAASREDPRGGKTETW